MKGYLMSKAKTWKHIFKMNIRPGGKVSLDELYEVYGKKYDIAEDNFIEWLKAVKLKGKLEEWLIVPESEDLSDVSQETTIIKEGSFETNTRGEIVASKMSVKDIMDLPVRKAREVIPTIMDAKLLKFALRELKPLPNKESLCRILDRRIAELSMNPH